MNEGRKINIKKFGVFSMIISGAFFWSCDPPVPEPEPEPITSPKGWTSYNPMIAEFYSDNFGYSDEYDSITNIPFSAVDTVIADFKSDKSYVIGIKYQRPSDTVPQYYESSGSYTLTLDPNVPKGPFLIKLSQKFIKINNNPGEVVELVQEGIYQIVHGTNLDTLKLEVIQTSNNPGNKPATPGKSFGSTNNGKFNGGGINRLLQRFVKPKS